MRVLCFSITYDADVFPIFCRMYQAFLASGDRQSARKILNKIPKDTRKIRMVIMGLHENRIKLEEYNYMGPKYGILR